MPADESKLTVYYDGSCPLCRAEIGFYARRDDANRIDFHDVSATNADPAPDLGRDTAMGRFHVRCSNGALASGAAGFFEIWKALPGWRYLGKLSHFPGVVPIAELAYRAFLRLRPALIRVLGPILKLREKSAEGSR